MGGRQASGFPCPICNGSSLADILDEQVSYRRLLLECADCRWAWWAEA